MKISTKFRLDGNIVKQDERYTVIDNSFLKNIIVSDTELNEDMCTGGHFHDGQEEVYIFVEGSGEIQIGEEYFPCEAGDMFSIPDGAFHRVCNHGSGILKFIAIFDGSRNH